MIREYRFIIIVTLIAVIVIPAYFFLDLYFYLHTPVNPYDSKRTFITLAPGENFSDLAADLYNHRLIKYPVKFKIAARIKGYDRKIITGEYAFSGSMAPINILNTLKNGTVYLHRLTIPEGYTIAQIAARAEKRKFCTKDEFLSAATNPEFAAKLGIPAKTCEGYLFPTTYFFPKNVTPERMITCMVRQLRKTITPEMEARAKELGLSMHQILTLASIIEKETAKNFEKPIIASVFYNRLKINMRLQSDPTVIYGLKNFNGDITKKDLADNTPYNTYVIYGLPPGPIANPGLKSIQAALYPAKTDFLYFVSKNDGTHQFSSNLADHNKAVQKYQLGASAEPSSNSQSIVKSDPASHPKSTRSTAGHP